MTTRLFRAHGEFCATHPWEVIVATLTLAACMLTVDQQHPAPPPKPTLRYCAECLQEAEYNAADLIVMTLIRCLAVLYCYYQFCNLEKLGSKYILGIAGLFTVFSSFVFTSTVLNLLWIDVSDLKDALFFFLLLIDLSKAAMLAQSALSASNQEEVKSNIARGMAVLGPTITLDTIVETLVIGVGTLSGVHRLEMLSYFACLSVLVNYIVFMTFYPACLSLILELSRTTNIYGNKQSLIARALKEEDHKSNPVVQRVKLIMSAGLMLVHARSRWPFKEDDVENIRPLVVEQHMTLNRTEDTTLHEYIMKWVTVSADHIVILILLLALVVKFVFFENKEELAEQLRAHISTESVDPGKKDNRFKMPLIKTQSFFLTNNTKEDSACEDKEVQTDIGRLESEFEKLPAGNDVSVKTCRSLEECLKIYNDSNLGGAALSDDEVILLVKNKHIPAYQIEKAVDDPERGVGIRRKILAREGNFSEALTDLPFRNYDYAKVMGACCENVIGYMPVPVGYAGPLNLDGRHVYVPMATTEGCLVASTNRGCRALLDCGVTSRVVSDGMTRGPVVRFPSITKASEAMSWMKCSQNFEAMKQQFDSSSRFARLSKLLIKIAGRHLFVRFEAKTGDAMGMNMVSKGTEMSLKYVQKQFPEMEILSLSGNFCTDKKPAAVNWIEGRGKSVVCEAIIPSEIVKKVLKTSTPALVDVNNSKNMIGSAVAGSIGGFNAHAANIVTAIYIATGQDPAQNIGSSNCMTLMEPWGETGEDLYVSCTMPSIEIGTVGGGTVLPAQSSCLEMLRVKGSHPDCPGENASQLARIVCGTVLAGELSLMAALTAGHLVRSHLRHNRSTTTIPEEFSQNRYHIPPCKDI
ncbi:3-hydroxy-3-methylglutaryl-coenzyme A reductase [Tribolium castaneum]|uniref:3-hydroxy-3-methylglutaryl coenzyme A reductase n=1 Tax=Tribolium castaneum TaxID=7070 RepID=A0A139WIA9_TRICA|nr:PREDICTED: 3-hydroxy-3-methylglutaryl-coenzyme A reductase [Tribolium castaneum]XP_973850.1 PREDICTED: 3-hydroxy-3-methylglutaryl-coenzyme A reductase [Tribolium castaneum]KYB27676.1 3-hydroxy-3-methylglutaryl-coenzyme A reductase-like Protein [Tribolium castaneum]|eukprot:XP_008193331.1 PREDICTED: 3-hydroxy-3-methylglutaryl-coenzyme A reductase [Tribolium castaneum]